MSRLLLVSNRLPVTVVVGPDGWRVEPSVGGLSAALLEPHDRTGGVWVGWPGPLETLGAGDRLELNRRLAERRMVPVHLSPEEVTRYYGAFSNGLLWPLFHYAMGNLPLEVGGWVEYERVNERFAETVVSAYQPGDTIWVHDYQLMLVAELVRRALPEARIGYFLHIPFPTEEIYAALPHRERLLEGLLGADVVGFHTAGYRSHFESAVARHLGLRAQNHRVVVNGRRATLGVFPVGVDAEGVAKRAAEADVRREVTKLQSDGTKLLLGIDRLDYTKGIPRRLLAFREMLTRNPEWRGRVRLVQIAVPSRSGVRAYRRLREEVDGLVGHINGTFGTPHWTPVHYVFRGIPQGELLALYRAADVMLVTPVRDGMNLVAKEFIASRADGDGVLVLSEFAGAAAELDEAVLVNPYDVAAAAAAYVRALTMAPAERRARMSALRAHVFGHTVADWTDSFLAALEGDAGNGSPRDVLEEAIA